MGIEYGGQRDTFVGYSDSDLGGCRDDSRSTTGFAFMLNGGAVFWRSRLQPTIADSSCEAEFMAAAEAIKEAMWFKKLLPNLGVIDEDEAVKIMCDNESAEAVLRSPRINEVSNHISRKWNFAKYLHLPFRGGHIFPPPPGAYIYISPFIPPLIYI